MVAARSGGFGGEVEWAGDRWRPDRLSRSVSSLGLWVTRLMVRSKGSSDCEGVVGCRSVTCSWRFNHGWSEEKRENEGGREEGWWTQLAWQMVDRVCTTDDGQTLHSEQSLHGDPIPLVLSLSLSLRVTNVLSEAGNQFKVKWVCNWFYRVGVFILQSTKIGFQFDWIFMCIQTPLRV